MKSTLTALAFVALTSSAPAALVTGTWVDRLGGSGGMILSNANTASPTMGDGSSNNADAESIYTTISTITLGSIGDKITLSGSATLTGIVGAGNQFRWGLYDSNGSSSDLDWLGYYGGQGHNVTGNAFSERVDNTANNTAWYMSGAGGASAIINNAAAPDAAFSNGTYDYFLTLELVSGGLQIDSSIIRTSDSKQFGLHSFLDTSVSTTTFDRVGFLSGNNIDADQIQFTDVDVTYIPEPSTSLLGALGALALIRRRRA